MTADLLARVQAVVAGVAGPGRTPPDAGPDTPLGQAGFWLDSVDLVEVVVAAEEAFDVCFEGEADLTPETLHSVRTLADLIASKRRP
jgi:acyl carrier protein